MIGRGNSYGGRDGKSPVDDIPMDLIPEKTKVLTLVAPLGIVVRAEGFEMGGVNRELRVFSLHHTEALGNEIEEDIVKELFCESFSEAMEGIVSWGVPIGETPEISEPSIETEFLGEVPFRGGKAEVDKHKCLKEGLGVIAFSAFVAVAFINKVIDEGEINGVKQNLQGLIGRGREDVLVELGWDIFNTSCGRRKLKIPTNP